VVAVRDDIRTGIAKLTRDVSREPSPTSRVLTVDDAEVDPVLGPDARQQLLHSTATRPPDDIANEENTHAED